MIEKENILFSPLKIGKTTLKNRLVLAPLAGFTDIAFRRLCKEEGAGLTVTEMVSVKGLCYKNENTAQLLTTAQNETPSCVQLFGHESDFFIKAIQSGELDKFDIIDINIGCPMPKVTKNGDGSSLLKTPAQAFRLIEDVAKTGRTVTVKMRTGWDEKSVDAVNFAKGAQNAGAAAITVHGRTTKQLYGGKADWDIIGNVAAALSIPVVGNGDVKNQSEALEKMKNYKTAAVMIGRGALGNPSIFSEKHVRDEQKREKLCQTLLKHIDYMLEYFNEKYTVVNMRKHLGYYLKGVKNTKELKSAANYILSAKELKEKITQTLTQGE